MITADRAARVDAIDALLPQTQCTKCGFSGCWPYAEAIAHGSAPINRCPPGGAAGIARLAGLLGVDTLPLDPACGEETHPTVALIDESRCIGCTLCIQACPVDAILGAAKKMHTVLFTECTGCDLCLPPCPVDCITMVPLDILAREGSSSARERFSLSVEENTQRARQRYEARNVRLIRQKEEKKARRAEKDRSKLHVPGGTNEATERMRDRVMKALARARARRDRV